MPILTFCKTIEMNRVLLSGVRVWITKEVIRVNPQLLKSHTSEWRAAGGALHWTACVNPHFVKTTEVNGVPLWAL